MWKIERMLVAVLAFASPLLLSGLAFAQAAGPSVAVHGDTTADFGYINWGETNANSATGKAVGELYESQASHIIAEASVNSQLSALVALQFFTITNQTDNNINGATPSPPATGGNAAFKTGGNQVNAEVHWRPTSDWDISAGNYLFPEWAAPMTEQTATFANPLNFFVIPAGGIYAQKTPTSAGGGGVAVWLQENTFIWNGIAGANADYKMGGTQIGLALSSQCTGEGAGSGQYCQNANQNTMSIVPHLLGKYGDLSVNAQINLVSGTVADAQTFTPAATFGGTPTAACASGLAPAGAAAACTSTVSVSSLGWALGAAYKITPDIRLAVDLQGWDVAKETKLGNGADGVWSNYGVKLDISQLMLYVFATTFNPFYQQNGRVTVGNGETMGAKDNVTNTAAVIRYTIPTASGVTLMPQIRSVTLGKGATNSSGKTEDVTDTTIDVIAAVHF